VLIVLKGSAVPALVALFVVTFLMGGLSITVVTDKATGIFESVGNEQNSLWVEDNINPVILDMCEQSGVQSAQPSGNLSNSFPDIQSISYTGGSYKENRDGDPYNGQETVYNRDINLNYSGTSNAVNVENTVAPVCTSKIYFNGTEPDGSKISWSDEIDLESDSLKFRVFETGSNGNITVQVRQD